MRKIRFVCCCAACALALVGKAAAAQAEETRVERLADDIWRVRVSRNGAWSESPMNRYGVFAKMTPKATGSKMDFGVVSAQAKHVGKGFEIRFPLAAGERVYGLGDCSRTHLQRRPGVYEMRVKNIVSYIPIPFAMTSRGWGVLANTSFVTKFDVGETDRTALVITAAEGEIDFYVFTGRDYGALLEAYTRLTGRPQLMPVFGYGFTYIHNMFDDMFGIVRTAREFRDRGIPCDVFGLEPGWMEYFYDFTTKKDWNTSRFRFPQFTDGKSATWIGALDRMGFKLSLWLCMNYDLFVFEEACAEGRAKPSRGKVKKNDSPLDYFFDEHTEGRFPEKKEIRLDRRGVETRADLALGVPVFRPDAMTGRDQDGTEPWFEHLKKFVDQGARCFKMDAACQVFETPERIWAGKYRDAEVHNVYSLVYAKQMYQGFAAYTDQRPLLSTPAGYAGYQQYGSSWAGDTGGGPKSLVSCLNLAMSGQPHQSCDIDVSSAERLHYGFLQPWCQQNNWYYFDQPWHRDAPEFKTFVDYILLRYRLLPYLYAAAAKAHATGWPIARPLAFAYPASEPYADVTTTYLLGDSLLVSAFAEKAVVPPGTWYDWRTGAALEGPCEAPVEATAGWGGALYVKAGAIVPMWPVRQHLEKGWNERVFLHVYLGADGSFDWYEDDGDSLGYLKGECAVAKLKLRGTTLTIGARQGAFKGMPAAHDVTVVWHEGAKSWTTELGQVRADEETTVSAPWFRWLR